MPTINKTQINQSGIDFSVTPAAAHQGARIDNNGENGSPIVNAVNIDWNGATLGSETINTTGDLLSYISRKVGSGSSSNPDSIHITFS